MAEEDPGPVVQRLILGNRARELRERAGLGLEAANSALRWYRGKLSKIETGRISPSPKDTEALLKLCNVIGAEAEDIRKLAAASRRYAAPERVADSGRDYVAFERVASTIDMVYPEVPGLLQTMEYARAQLMWSPVILGSEVMSMAAAREERGERLRTSSTRTRLILGEEALYREVGGNGVLRRQLERVLEFSRLPHVAIRVMPFKSGAAPGLSCPFTLLYIEAARAYIVYAETLTGADYIKTPGAYSLVLEQMWERSLSDEDTRSLLQDRIRDIAD